MLLILDPPPAWKCILCAREQPFTISTKATRSAA